MEALREAAAGHEVLDLAVEQAFGQAVHRGGENGAAGGAAVFDRSLAWAMVHRRHGVGHHGRPQRTGFLKERPARLTQRQATTVKILWVILHYSPAGRASRKPLSS